MDAYVASELRGHCAQGQTLPLYLACRAEGEPVVYQTKLAGRRSGLSARELGVELLGTTVAHNVGLHVARPALVNLPWTVVEQIEGVYAFGVQDTTAFGVVWKAGLTPYLPDVELARLRGAECATLIALDLLLTNGDRTEPNPNVCWDGDRLLVFDFEHSLELPKLEFERRYALHLETLEPLLETHLVASCVERGAIRATLENVLERLGVEALRRDAFALPRSWHEEWLDNVEYLGYITERPAPMFDRLEALCV